MISWGIPFYPIAAIAIRPWASEGLFQGGAIMDFSMAG